jgi:hypothetical protein
MTRNPGRIAGFWYLLLIVLGPLRLIYIPIKLFVQGNAAATMNNIAAHEFLFRVGIVSELAGVVVLIPLAALVYKSQFLPQFLGVWLAISGLAYVALSIAGTLWPEYQGVVFTISQPATFSEIALALWLAIKGAKPPELGPAL